MKTTTTTRPEFDQATYDTMIATLVEGYLNDAVTDLQTRCLSGHLFDEALAYLRLGGGDSTYDDAALDAACHVGSEIRRQPDHRTAGRDAGGVAHRAAHVGRVEYAVARD